MAAGCPGSIPHDFRRTAVRDLVSNLWVGATRPDLILRLRSTSVALNARLKAKVVQEELHSNQELHLEPSWHPLR